MAPLTHIYMLFKRVIYKYIYIYMYVCVSETHHKSDIHKYG